MIRDIGAAVAAYVVMFVVVFVGNTLAWVALGPDGSFQPGSWTSSAAWNVTSILVGAVAALAGGLVCALVSRRGRALGILIGIIVVLSLLFVAMTLAAEPPTDPRPEDVSMAEAMTNARAPLWSLIVNPIVGIAGVVVGARLRGGRRTAD